MYFCKHTVQYIQYSIKTLIMSSTHYCWYILKPKKKKKKFRVATKSAGLDSARTPAAARCCIRAQAPIQLKMIVHNDICSKIKVVWILKISTGLHNELKQALHLFHAFLVKNATCGYYHRPYMP